MKKSLRMIWLLTSMVMTLSMLMGCGNKGEEKKDISTDTIKNQEGGNEEGNKGEQVIKLALWDYESVGYDKAIIEAFEKENPDIQVQVISSPNADYDNKLSVMLAGGDEIDVFYGKSNTQYPSLVNNNYAMGLNELIEKNNFDIAPYGDLLDKHYNIDGNIYALPYRSNNFLMYYNKNVFDEAGIPYPSNDMTWEEFRELGLEVTSGDDTNKIYGISFVPKTSFIVPAMIGAGKDFDVMTSDYSVLKHPLEYMLAIQNEDQSYEEYAISKSMNQDQMYFLKGQSATLYNGIWFTQMLIENADKFDFEWGVAKAPYWAGQEQMAFTTSTPVLINANTKNADLAWKLVEFITGEKGAAVMAEHMMVPAYMTDEVMAQYKESTQIDDQSFEATTNNIPYGIGNPTPISGMVLTMMQEETELVITGNQSIEEALANMEVRRAEIIENNK